MVAMSQRGFNNRAKSGQKAVASRLRQAALRAGLAKRQEAARRAGRRPLPRPPAVVAVEPEPTSRPDGPAAAAVSPVEPDPSAC
jgi:hypothetical protein